MASNVTAACVKRYLDNPDELYQVEPKKVRRQIAEACYAELSLFSRSIKHLQKRKRMSEEKLRGVMGWERFGKIPDRFKGTHRFGLRSRSSINQEKAVLAQLMEIM